MLSPAPKRLGAKVLRRSALADLIRGFEDFEAERIAGSSFALNRSLGGGLCWKGPPPACGREV